MKAEIAVLMCQSFVQTMHRLLCWSRNPAFNLGENRCAGHHIFRETWIPVLITTSHIQSEKISFADDNNFHVFKVMIAMLMEANCMQSMLGFLC